MGATESALRQTFAGEIAARLPRLLALAAGDDDVLEAAHRDAHSLASSAVIVHEPRIAELAGAVELDLQDGPLTELLLALQDYVP